MRALTPEGSYVCVGGSMKQYFQAMLLGPLISMMGSKKMGTVFAPPTHEDYNFLIELFKAGKLAPVIDRRFPLSELTEALQYYGEGHSMGKVVITVERAREQYTLRFLAFFFEEGTKFWSHQKSLNKTF